ncbi:MAG: YoaK family protein, partial [Firmicutes bacterium]|nr:YoaK family protein [Bacillota bacterium]
IINQRIKNIRIHWRQISVLVEVIMLGMVAFIPETNNSLANAIISFSCGIQLESFRKIRGNSIATTMCIGNLRSGTYNLDQYVATREPSYLKKAFLYFGIIASFVIGAVVESRMILRMGSHAILLCPALLMIVLLIMFHKAPAGDTDANAEG